MVDRTISKFRQKRGAVLARQIHHLSKKFGRKISIIDVGGRRSYWENVGFSGISRITIVNNDPVEIAHQTKQGDLFSYMVGDATSLDNFETSSFDLYHSNSVIEHVGSWTDMNNKATEARRLAKSGWVQTPAWEFPFEPHFRVPFIHWFATPIRASALKLSCQYVNEDLCSRRFHAERINLLTKTEFAALFPECGIDTERFFFLKKSYIARW